MSFLLRAAIVGAADYSRYVGKRQTGSRQQTMRAPVIYRCCLHLVGRFQHDVAHARRPQQTESRRRPAGMAARLPPRAFAARRHTRYATRISHAAAHQKMFEACFSRHDAAPDTILLHIGLGGKPEIPVSQRFIFWPRRRQEHTGAAAAADAKRYFICFARHLQGHFFSG